MKGQSLCSGLLLYFWFLSKSITLKTGCNTLPKSGPYYDPLSGFPVYGLTQVVVFAAVKMSQLFLLAS
jgi:hypothetical protein